MKSTFIATSGTRFMVTGDITQGSSVVTTHFVPTVDDMLEFAQCVQEARDPQPEVLMCSVCSEPYLPGNVHYCAPERDLVRDLHGVNALDDVPSYAHYSIPREPLFLVNGAFFRMQYDDNIPKGEIHYVGPDGKKTVLVTNFGDTDTHGIAWG